MPAAEEDLEDGCGAELSGACGLRWRVLRKVEGLRRRRWRAAMFGLLSKAGGGRSGRKGALTVFRNDGTVLEYHRRVRCSVVLSSHPNHLVCPAAAVKEQGGMLSGEEFLELGRVYFLLPNPVCLAEETRSVEARSVHQAACPVQFVISKAQLTQILGEATRAANATQTAGRKPVKPSRRSRSKQHWVASLESIPEYVPI